MFHDRELKFVEIEAERLVRHAAKVVLDDPTGRTEWSHVGRDGRSHSLFRAIGNSQLAQDATRLQGAAYTVVFARHHMGPAAKAFASLRLVRDRAAVQIIDFGAGTGCNAFAYGAACLEVGDRVPDDVAYVALDHAPELLKLNEEFVGVRFPEWNSVTSSSGLSAEHVRDDRKPIASFTFVFRQEMLTRAHLADWAQQIGTVLEMHNQVALIIVDAAQTGSYGNKATIKDYKGHLREFLAELEELGTVEFGDIPDCRMFTDNGVRFGLYSLIWYYGNASFLDYAQGWWTFQNEYGVKRQMEYPQTTDFALVKAVVRRA